MDYREKIKEYIEIEKNTLSKLSIDDINEVMNILESARLNNKRIFICGNGGSASTASHFVCDFNKGVSYNQNLKYDFECLNDNIPMMLATANDIGYDEIFVTPLKNKMKTGDIVIGISGSGNSENIIRAIQYANAHGGCTIALTGYSGGRLRSIARHCIHVNINNMQITEDMHLVLEHMMMFILSEM